MDAESIAIIQGPPGTGKTNVIIEIILQILKENSRNPDMEPKKYCSFRNRILLLTKC